MKNCIKLLCRLSVTCAFIAPLLISCYDDQALWDKLNNLEAKVDSLVNDLNSQAEALSSLMSDGSTIASCTKNEDGSYLIELSDGTEFTVLSKNADASALVSFVEVSGVRCWATYGADGELVALTDASGKPIPVDLAVSVSIKDGKYCLVIGGKEYVTGYDAEDVVSVFSSCTPHTDASGQVYAMTFTFGDGIEVTVTVDGYKGVMFKLSNAGSNMPVSEYYVDFGATQTFLMELDDVVDYVMQIPDGWRVNEYVDELTGDTYIDITAPSEETIAAGAAVAIGDLKVVSVVDGGKATVTKLVLSTDPFKTYNISATKAVFEPFYGIQKVVYGLMNLSAFDKSSLLSEVNELLKSSVDLPAGYAIAEGPVDKTFAELYGDELTDDGEYVFWAIPALYSERDDVGFYVVERMLRTRVIAPISASVVASEVTVLDANVKVNVRGTLSMYAGVSPKSETLFEEIVYQINNKAIDPTTVLSYNGSAASFPAGEDLVELSPNTSYVVWVVPVEANKDTYSVTDVISDEFTTLDVLPGGTLSLTAGSFTTDCSSISAPLSSTGAAMIYYAYLSDTEAKRLSQADNVSKMGKIQSASSFTVVRAESAVATIEFVKPETTMWLFAVAVGPDGKYGEVISQSATTSAVAFNSLTVSVDEVSLSAKEAKFKVNVTGGEALDYIYWCGKMTDPFWLYEEYSDGTRPGAENYMAANPDAEQIRDSMNANGEIEEDGTLTISELDLASTYVLLVLAKDESGLYSKAGYVKFDTPAANLGDLVTSETEQWKTTKQWIEDNLVWDESSFEAAAGSGQGSAAYAFDIKIPTDLTAFIYCFGLREDAIAVEDQIIYVEEECSRSAAYPKVVYDENGEAPSLPSWYDDNGKLIEGSMLSLSNFFVHGDPSRGFVTYFADGGHDDHCPVWSDDACQSYVNYQESIKKYCSFEYWKEYIIDFGTYWYNDDPNHEYSRILTDEDNINKIAQEYTDLYTKYYKDAEPIFYVNTGDALRMLNRNATGLDSNGNVIDKVTVVLKDMNNNYYEPMFIDVPNYFN